MKHDIHSFNAYLSSAYCVLAGRRWTRLEYREGSHWKNSKKGGKRIRRECFYYEREVLRKGEWTVFYYIKCCIRVQME